MKPIPINTHIDCSNNSNCSVGDILLATKQGAFESVFGTFSVNISNPVRELLKTMDAPAPAHLKEMYNLIRFVLSTKDYGLKF